jgi:hypothetical protein
MAHEMDHLKPTRANTDELSILDGVVDNRERVGVGRMRDRAGAGLGDDILEAKPVVLMSVRCDHSGQSGRPDEVKQPVRFVGRVDEDLVPSGLAAKQVRVITRSDSSRTSGGPPWVTFPV